MITNMISLSLGHLSSYHTTLTKGGHNRTLVILVVEVSIDTYIVTACLHMIVNGCIHKMSKSQKALASA